MKKTFTTNKGKNIYIEIDEVDFVAIATDLSGNEIGRFKFNYHESDHNDCLKLVWAYLNKQGDAYLRSGIGRECIKRMTEYTDYSICVSKDDGQPKDDGSHLTQDAPAFVRQLKADGLLFEC